MNYITCMAYITHMTYITYMTYVTYDFYKLCGLQKYTFYKILRKKRWES